MVGFQYVWQVYLYQPLVNVLILFYNTIAGQNLGVAVVELTVALRLVLLPFSIFSERNKVVYAALEHDIRAAERAHHADPEYFKEYVRDLLKKHHVHPWAKAAELIFQLLVLVLLYQVFITGIQGLQLSQILYHSIDYPGRLATDFFSFEIGERSVVWAGAIGLVLFFEILISLKGSESKPQRSDLAYLILFPLMSFALLWYLPMVKSLFIATSLLFSYMLSFFRKILVKTH